MRKSLKVTTFLMAVMLTLTACSKNDAPGVNGGTGGKVLRIAKDTDIMSLDTNIATDGLSFEVIEQFTDGLIDYDKDGNIVPRIAESWEASTDGSVYTFKLRSDAKWSNGDPVTAHDFVYSWRRILDPKTASEYAIMPIDAGILNAKEVNEGAKAPEELGAKALDDHTLEVTLVSSVPYFLQLMTFPSFNPVNEKFVTEAGSNYAQAPEYLLSNGPFKLTQWEKLNSWRLEKNTDYMDADDVKLDAIEYVKRQDYSTAALEFDSGAIDITKISSDLVARYKDQDAFTQVVQGFVWYLSPNQKVPELQNANLRLALAHAIDRDHIVKDVMADGSEAANYIVPKGLATGPDGKDFRETSQRYFEYDLAKAQEYFDKAKAELGKSEINLTVLIEDSDESRTNAEQLQSDLNQLDGFSLQIDTVIKDERLSRMRKGDFDLGLTRWGPDYADPYTYMGTLFVSGSSYNHAGYSNPAYDALMSQVGPGGSLANDTNARWEAFKQGEKIIMDDAAVIPIWQSGEAMLINPKVSGVEIHVVGMTAYRNVTIAD